MCVFAAVTKQPLLEYVVHHSQSRDVKLDAQKELQAMLEERPMFEKVQLMRTITHTTHSYCC
jgi:hypothetical protein